MINKVNFMGREEMLGKTLSKIERHEYTNPAKVYSKEELQAALDKIDSAVSHKYKAKAQYKSPYEPIETKAASAGDEMDFINEVLKEEPKLDFVPDTAPHGIDYKA